MQNGTHEQNRTYKGEDALPVVLHETGVTIVRLLDTTSKRTRWQLSRVTVSAAVYGNTASSPDPFSCL
jgi:hypothetical protein